MSSNRINAARRTQWLQELADTSAAPLDVLVIGGGITGAGVALDAATRGLRVALVESRDLGSGTSGFSSKLIHGGLRYLAKGDLPIARESAIERHHLMTTIAPHLVHPVQFLLPLGHYFNRKDAALTKIGLRLGDVLRRACRTPGPLLPSPSSISALEVGLLAPTVDEDGLRGGLTYWDGQVEDDIRLVVALARTAAAHSAMVLTRCHADEVTGQSARLTDTKTGESLVAHAKTVVNATGVWAQTIETDLHTTPSRGSHLVVRSADLGDPRAVITVPVPGRFGRFVMVIPQPDGLCYIGLTDEPDPDADGYAVAVPGQDEEFLLETVSAALGQPLTTEHVVGRFAGLRPLASSKHQSGASADMSRRHVLIDEPGRPLTITGGKLTTYRAMAQDTVDAVLRRLNERRACVTRELPLIGAADRRTLAEISAPPRLVRRFGTEAPLLVELAADDPRLLEPVHPSSPVLGVEVVYAVLAEGALDIDDFLDRRIRAGLVPADREQIRWECTKIIDQALAALAR